MRVDPDTGVVEISNHSLGLATCSTAANLYALGYRGIIAKEAYFISGIAAHESFADFFINGSKESALAKFSAHYEKWALNNVPSHDRLAHDNVRRILGFWYDRNPLDQLPFEVIPELVECEFKIPLTDDGKIIFTGRPDAIVRSKRSKKVYILDHKSVGYLNPGFEEKFQLDTQMSSYYYAAQKYGLDVDGIFINAIEFKKLSDSPKPCPQHKVPKTECAVEHVQYKMIPYSRSPELIAAWLRTAITLALKFRQVVDIAPNLCYVNRLPMEGLFIRSYCDSCQFSEFCKSGRTMPKLLKVLVD